jgi:uncharacterized protein YwqG
LDGGKAYRVSQNDEFEDEYKTLVIPESYNGLPVTEIGESAFSWCEELTEIELPPLLTSIEKRAFYDCKNLVKINIPPLVTNIGREAFTRCESLKEIKLPPLITSIGEGAFLGCPLESIELPPSITSIEEEVFRNCEFSNIKIPSSVTKIGECAFHACKHLINIELPESVTEIEAGAFRFCTSLEKIVIPSSVKSIGHQAFEFCESLKEVVLPPLITKIKLSSFCGCASLEKITIPSSVTSIGDEAFARCEKLKDINIPDSVTSIGEYAFHNTGLVNVKIPASVTKIEKCVFVECKDLETIEIPESATELGTNILKDCKKIEEITIPAKFAGNAKKHLGLNIKKIKKVNIIGEVPVENTLPAIKFQFTKEQKALLREQGDELGLNTKQLKLIEKFIIKYTVPCYNLEITEGEPGPLDSSIGGIPYLPVGETLPEEPLLLQINFEGVELEGYPNKGIFQLFAEQDDIDHTGDCGAVARYCENITASYQKDVQPSNHALARGGCRKIKLEKDWSMFPLMYDSFLEERDIFAGCELLKKLEESGSDVESVWGIMYEMFPTKSNLGGYWHSPQGQAGGPNDTLLFLDNDLISWGDAGVFWFWHKGNIAEIEKDQPISNGGDMH